MPGTSASTYSALPPGRATRAAAAIAGPLRHVDHELAPLEGLIVELCDGLLGLRRSGHLHEAEASGLAREAIRDHRRGLDGSALGEVLAKTLGSRRIRKPTDI